MLRISGSVVKNLPANARDTGDMGLIPGLGRSPGGENVSPLQYSWLKTPMDRGASVSQLSLSVVSNSLWPQGLQHARPPCPLPTTRVYLIHVCWVSDGLLPSQPLSIPSPPIFNLSQHQSLFQWVSSSHQVAKYWGFSISISPSNEY